MGYVVKTTCNDCGYIKSFEIGQGINDYKKSVIIDSFSEKMAEHVKKTLTQHNIFNYERIIGFCSKCGKLETVSYLSYFEGDEERYVLDKCDCGNNMKIVARLSEIEGRKEDLKCPICDGTLDFAFEGMFD